MPQLRHGFVVNGSACSYPDRLRQWVADCRPSTMVVLDGWDLAVGLYNASGEQTRVAHRAYDAHEGSEWKFDTPEVYCDALTNWGHPEIYRQVLCEPALKLDELPGLVIWLSRVLDILRQRGFKAVWGNIGIATIPAEWVEAGHLDALLRLEHEHRGWHVLGVHEYTGIELPFGVGQWATYASTPTDYFLNPAYHAPVFWPKAENLPVARVNGQLPPYWHIRRSDWLTIRARELGLGDPLFWVTENGWDSMPDIGSVYNELVNQWGIAPGYANLRGMNSLANVWRAYWPQWSADRAAFEQMKWLDSIYPENYIGRNQFMWTADHWTQDGFDMSQNVDYLALMRQYAEDLRSEPDPLPEPEPEPPVPLPDAFGWGLALFSVLFVVILGIIVYFANRNNVAFDVGGTMETLQIMPVNEAAQVLLAAILAIVAGGMSSPITVPVVNLVKFILKQVGRESLVSGNVLAALVAGVVTVIIWVSRWAGVELEIHSVLDLLATVLPPLLTFLGLAAGQKVVFNWALRKEVLVYNYRRS